MSKKSLCGAALALTQVLGILVAAAAPSGCAAGGSYRAWSPEYAYGFYNATGQKLRDCEIHYPAQGRELHIDPYWLSPGQAKTWSFAPDPIPEAATAVWRTEDGQLHSQEVRIASRIKDLPHFSGTVWIRYSEEGPDVVPMTYAERSRLAAQGKWDVPE